MQTKILEYILVITWYILVTVEASRSLSGTFLTVAQAAVSNPFTATEVVPPWFMAWKEKF